LHLYDRGMSTRKIAKKLGISRSGAWHHVHMRDIGFRAPNHNISNDAPEKLQLDVVPAGEIANMRAENLSSVLHDIITQGNWPIVNHEALLVDARRNSFYDARTQEMVERAGSPGVYITDILKAAPIEDYKGRRFLFTHAQNSTSVNEEFLDNMEAYAEERGADIVVGAATYQTSWWAESAEHSRTYDERIKKYLCFGRLYIGPDFFFAAETNIIATAAMPISDMVSYSENKWVVIPHSKQNLVTIPTTDPHKLCPQILSTGSVTIPKVLAKKAGIKSIFHHIFGFVIVEFDMEGKVFCRHVNAGKDGSFYDLNYFVQDGVVSMNDEKPDYLMPADIHRGKLDLAKRNDVMKTFGFDGQGGIDYDNLISFLKPRRLIIQDLHDGNVDNHYIDMGQRVENAAGDRNSLETEVKLDGLFLSYLLRMHGSYVEEVIVDESNHDLRLERYAKEHRYVDDPYNVIFGQKLHLRYLEYRTECGRMRNAGVPRKRFSLHEWAVRSFYQHLNRVTWVYDGESRVINDVEVGHHGFRGTNGSRASIFGYVRIGAKISYGDKHAPSIVDGAFQAGVMALQQGYNIGPSSWAVSHILQYANGKRCMLTMNDGAFQYITKGILFYS
jgi:hypothetical protein